MKKILSLVSTLLLFVSSMPFGFSAKAATVTSGKTGDCTWTLDGTVLTISGKGKMEDYDESRPWGTDITDVVIGEGVTYISDRAFPGCKGLTSITIPNSVTNIGNFAFYGCTGLTSITIPNSVTGIGERAFSDCTGLSSIIIPDGVTYIGRAAFSYCTGLTDLVISESVKSIYFAAFLNCSNLKSLTILCRANTVDIDKYAFDGCNSIEFAALPTSEISIINRSKNTLKEVVINGGTTVSEISSFTKLEKVTFASEITEVADFCFCSALTDIVFPEGVTEIGSGAFRYCTNLKSVTIPESLEKIGAKAFDSCPNLSDIYYGGSFESRYKIEDDYASLPLSIEWHYKNTQDVLAFELNDKKETASIERCAPFVTSVDIPSSITRDGKVYRVTSISQYAFSSCSELETVNFNVTDYMMVGSVGVFKNCAKLKTVNFGEDAAVVPDCILKDCTGLKSVTISDGVTSIGSEAFSGCTGLKSVTISDSVTSIGSEAFSGCSKLESITIPNGVERIYARAFENCTGLTSITFSDSLVGIDVSVFSGCTGLTSITLPSSVTGIGDSAFINCSGLTSITIPNSVVSIGGYAFYGCKRLTSITIPNRVTDIGKNAFYECSGLTSITIPNSVISMGDGAFRGCRGLTSIKISDRAWSIGDSVFENCSGLTSITIPNSVTRIGNRAFQGCKGLTSITIPSSVTSIGFRAFNGCTGLTSIKISDRVGSIGNFAFEDCSGLTSITIPYSVKKVGVAAFSDCVSLKTVNYNATAAEYMGTASDPVFKGCVNLKTVNIGENVASIPEHAFRECVGLLSVTIPSSVKKISDYAFYGCSALETVDFNAADCSLETTTFDKCINLKTVNFGKRVTKVPSGIFSGCTGLISITIPSKVTSIGDDAFKDSDKSKVTIYTDSAAAAAYAFARKNGYRCIVSIDGTQGMQYAVTDNVLEIIGSGKMPNYNLFTSTPWYAEKDNITRIVIDGRITDVGTYSFYGFDKLEAVVTENSGLVFHQYALNTANTALTVYSYAGGALEQYCNDNGLRFVAPLGTPTLLGVTENTITVKAENGLEYSLDKESWQTDGVFTGLSPVTEYTVYVRREGGYTPIEGTPLKVKTPKRVISATAVPAIQAYDTTTVTLKPMTGYEYSKDGITWQQSNVFTGIVSDRIYGFRQRLAETDTDFASASSRPLYYAMPSKPEILSVGATTLTVKAVEGFEYSLDKITWQKDPYFSALIYGMEYTVYQRIAEVDNADTYAVISAGTAMLINGIDKKTPATPSAPVAESKTSDTVTLKKTAGYEYRMDSGAWQKSPVFTGLAPNSTHRFYQRVAETDAAYASDSSTALTVQLDPPFTRGDLDGDEEITDWDGVLLARYLAGWNVDISNVDALDIDGDGEITDWDGVLLDRHLAGWDIKIS